MRTINGKKGFSNNYYLEGKGQDRSYEVVLNLTYMSENESHQLIPFLTTEEQDYLKFIKSDKRLKSYLYGRYSLKKAVSEYSKEVQLKNINIKNGIFGQPVIELEAFRSPGGSLSHCETCAASLVYDESLIMGIDIEEVNRNVKKALENNITAREVFLIKNQAMQEALAFVIFWTAKEALAKCLKTGLTVPLELYEVEKIENKEKYFKLTFTHFMQYSAYAFVFDTYVCSITYPKLIELSLDITNI